MESIDSIILEQLKILVILLYVLFYIYGSFEPNSVYLLSNPVRYIGHKDETN